MKKKIILTTLLEEVDILTLCFAAIFTLAAELYQRHNVFYTLVAQGIVLIALWGLLPSKGRERRKKMSCLFDYNERTHNKCRYMQITGYQRRFLLVLLHPHLYE